MQIRKANDMSDYYKMVESPTPKSNNKEVTLYTVYLQANTVFQIYNGATPLKTLYKDTYTVGNASQFSIVSETAGTGKVTATGYYAFHYQYEYNSMYVEYSSSYTAPSTTGTKYSFKVQFSGDSVVRTLNIYSSNYTPYIFIFEKNSDNKDTVYYSTSGYQTTDGTINGSGITSSGTPTLYSSANGKTIVVGKATTTRVIFASSSTWSNQTYDLSLGLYMPDEENTVTLESGGKYYPKKLAEPVAFGSTSFDGSKQSTNDDKAIRNAATMYATNNGTNYTYTTYVAVSRASSEYTTSDNTICFLIFQIVDASGNPITNNNTPLVSFDVSRTATDEDGNPSDGEVSAPKLYGSATTLSGINYIPRNLSGTNDSHYVDEYYEDGMYCVLFFGDYEEQYFALDITIVTQGNAGTFYLKATASNINHWQRYEQGYGSAWGFYMGGLVNGVWTWDPRRTLKMEGTPVITGAGDVSTDPDGVYYPNKPIEYSLTVSLTAGTIVKPYMLDSTGERQQDGNKAKTAYFVPKNITAPAGLYDSNTPYFNVNAAVSGLADMNIYIPKDGEYTFILRGNAVPYKSGNSVWYVNIKDKTKTPAQYTDANKPSNITNANGWYALAPSNFLIDDLIISYASDIHTVTLNAGDGAWSDGTTEHTTLVPDGTPIPESVLSADNAPTPNQTGYTFDCWYYNGAKYNNQNITSDVTLIAHYEEAKEPDPPQLVYKGASIAFTKSTTQSDATVVQYELTNISLTAGETLKFIDSDKADITYTAIGSYPAINISSRLKQSGGATLTATVNATYKFVLKQSVSSPTSWCLDATMTGNIDDGWTQNANTTNTGVYRVVVSYRSDNSFVYTDDGFAMSYVNSQYELKNLYLQADLQFRIYYGNSATVQTISLQSINGVSSGLNSFLTVSSNTVTVVKSGYYTFYRSGNNLYVVYKHVKDLQATVTSNSTEGSLMAVANDGVVWIKLTGATSYNYSTFKLHLWNLSTDNAVTAWDSDPYVRYGNNTGLVKSSVSFGDVDRMIVRIGDLQTNDIVLSNLTPTLDATYGYKIYSYSVAISNLASNIKGNNSSYKTHTITRSGTSYSTTLYVFGAQGIYLFNTNGYDYGGVGSLGSSSTVGQQTFGAIFTGGTAWNTGQTGNLSCTIASQTASSSKALNGYKYNDTYYWLAINSTFSW